MKKTELITVSAYELQAVYDTLYETLEWLEQYIEKAGYYPNWQSKKQIPNSITRTDIDSIDSKRMKSIFSTSLFALRNLTRNKPDFLLKELEVEFCKWLDGSGINADNCHSELSQCLVNISQVLKGKGEEFVKARRKEVDENITKMSKEEREKNFYELVTAYHEPLDNEGKKAKSLEGQTFRDVNNESRFVGNANKGEEIFRRIKERQQLGQVGSSVSQSNSEIIRDIRQNPQNWRVDEIIVEFNNFGGTRQEVMLIHQSARLDDYDQQTGRLNLVNNSIYQASRFSTEEQAEINRALNISQQQSAQVQQPPYKWSWQ